MILVFISSFCTFFDYLFCSYVLSSRKKIMWDINLLNTAINIPWEHADIGGHNMVSIFYTFVIANCEMCVVFPYS